MLRIPFRLLNLFQHFAVFVTLQRLSPKLVVFPFDGGTPADVLN
jgi:hypothetical protein